MRLWIKNALDIYSNSQTKIVGLVIEDNLISELLLTNRPPKAIDKTFDASDQIVLPGLINTHHHFYQTLTRANPAALNVELFSWLKRLYPIWAGLDEEMIAISTQLAAIELLQSGCTLAADHHYLFPSKAPHTLDIQVNALKDIGIRAHLTRGSMSLGTDQGGLPPQNTVQNEDEILKDCERVLNRYHDPKDGSHMQIALAPCSPFSVSEGLMKDSAVLARKHGARLHTHLAETHDETNYCIKMFGDRPVDYLERVGWLAEDVWLAHGIHFNDDEIARLGAAKVGISHCPSSNMMLSSGVCRTLELEAAGCAVGLGVDGSASNDCSNLGEELRQAFLLSRLHYGAKSISHLDPLRWATKGSADCLGRSDVGAIEVGLQADLCFFKLDEPRYSGLGEPLAAPALSGVHTASNVMVAGEWRVKGGEIPNIDIQQLIAKHKQAAHKLIHL